MPASNARLIGINEVGEVNGGVDTSWGRTQEDGVGLQLTANVVDLMSGQAFMKEDVRLTSAQLQIVAGLIFSELSVLRRIWGLPASALTGDLTHATAPTAEVLSIQTNTLGTVEKELYALGAGPISTRRINAKRARAVSFGELRQAKNAFMLPQATWEVLAPDSGAALIITDAL
jgi:hypothetical protein